MNSMLNDNEKYIYFDVKNTIVHKYKANAVYIKYPKIVFLRLAWPNKLKVI